MKRVLAAVFFIGLTVGFCARAQDNGQVISTSIRNTGFEDPAIVAGSSSGAAATDWFVFSSSDQRMGITDSRKKSGMQSFQFRAQPGSSNAYQGIAQKFKALPNQHVVFTVHAMNDPIDPIAGGSYGQVSIEWQDAAGAELSRLYGPSWGVDSEPGRWQKVAVDSDAPEGAAVGVVVITFYSNEANGNGSCYVDDADMKSRMGAD